LILFRRILLVIKNKLTEHKAAYIAGGFFILSSLLAGFIAASNLSVEVMGILLQKFWGFGSDAAFVLFFFQLLWWRLLAWALFTLSTLWFIGVPFAMVLLIWYASFWSLGWGCIFSVLLPLQYVWVTPIFAVLFVIHVVAMAQLVMHSLQNLKKCIAERKIPKTATDIYREAIPYYKASARCFLLSCACALIEALMLPVIF